MKINQNNGERMLRGVAGAALLSLAFWGPKNKLFLAGLVPLVTGATGSCPLYSALDISTKTEDRAFGDSYFHSYSKGAISGIEGYNPSSTSEMAAGHPIVGVS